MMFANRLDAGCQLGTILRAQRYTDPIVVGISRGGVPVAAAVARLLGVPLEICVVRKLFSPGSPAYSIGAVAEYGAVYLDEIEISKLAMSPTDVQAAIAHETSEVERLGELLRDQPPLSLCSRDVILVDDGVTTTSTLHAAALSARSQKPASLTLAVPFASARLLAELRSDFDRVLCLVAEDTLVALGYRDLWPVSENEVAAELADSRRVDATRFKPVEAKAAP